MFVILLENDRHAHEEMRANMAVEQPQARIIGDESYSHPAASFPVIARRTIGRRMRIGAGVQCQCIAKNRIR